MNVLTTSRRPILVRQFLASIVILELITVVACESGLVLGYGSEWYRGADTVRTGLRVAVLAFGILVLKRDSWLGARGAQSHPALLSIVAIGFSIAFGVLIRTLYPYVNAALPIDHNLDSIAVIAEGMSGDRGFIRSCLGSGTVLSILVIGPLYEELVYRHGVCEYFFETRQRRIFGSLISVCAFYAVHPAAWSPFRVTGAVSAYSIIIVLGAIAFVALYVRYRSIALNVGCHVVYNASITF